MRNLYKRLAVASAVAASGGFLLQPNTGCVSYFAEAAIISTDFCFIFDCQNGILGGTIDPCSGRRGDGTGGDIEDGPLFADCPTDDTP